MHPSDGYDDVDTDAPPVWTAFGDLMACLFGLFVLFFVGLVSMQVSLTQDLEASRAEADEATARLETLESALAGPLASGLITLVDGRIGIRGSVLFDLSSAEVRPAGRRLLRQLAPPIQTYLERHRLAIMVSGFTDDLALRPEGEFADNWELSAQRALTVTRELVAAGIAPEQLVAAGFGEHHPIVPNDTDEHRAQNRRVEIAPIPLPEALRTEHDVTTATNEDAPDDHEADVGVDGAALAALAALAP